jgi:hypothetical protein
MTGETQYAFNLPNGGNLFCSVMAPDWQTEAVTFKIGVLGVIVLFLAGSWAYRRWVRK